MIDRHLGEVNDLESDLVALGREWVTIPTRDFADHFAMVRQINAEAAHFPQAALDAWQEAGPRRVQHALADAFARLDASGLLRVGDPRRAAHHFALLVGAEISERTFHGAIPLGADEVSAISPTGSRPSSTATVGAGTDQAVGSGAGGTNGVLMVTRYWIPRITSAAPPTKMVPASPPAANPASSPPRHPTGVPITVTANRPHPTARPTAPKITPKIRPPIRVA
ncbi:transcriptional regulator [Rhodococcus opacus PD630]|nr:transcriptional regulator [Rhodococcus opacus PD630]